MAKTPYIGGGLLCDRVEDATDKPNCYGVFTKFLSWDFPSKRSGNLVFSIFNIEKQTNLKIVYGKKEQSEKKELINYILDHTMAGLIVVPYTFVFESSGLYEINFILNEKKSNSKVAFMVEGQDWPIFNQKELNFIKKNPELFPSIKINVKCEKCSHLYIFEDILLDQMEPVGGVIKFPDNEEFKCVECENLMYLKDLHGQIRSTYKTMLLEKMGGK